MTRSDSRARARLRRKIATSALTCVHDKFNPIDNKSSVESFELILELDQNIHNIIHIIHIRYSL